MLGIHKNPNWKEFLKCCESFLRKSSVCTLTYLNPGFGGPWDMLWIFLGYSTFIILTSKEVFWPKNFWSIMKVPYPKNIHNIIQDLGQSKYKLRIFSKRTHAISKILFNLGSYEYLASLESNIGRCHFFDIHNCKKTVCIAFWITWLNSFQMKHKYMIHT